MKTSHSLHIFAIRIVRKRKKMDQKKVQRSYRIYVNFYTTDILMKCLTYELL